MSDDKKPEEGSDNDKLPKTDLGSRVGNKASAEKKSGRNRWVPVVIIVAAIFIGYMMLSDTGSSKKDKAKNDGANQSSSELDKINSEVDKRLNAVQQRNQQRLNEQQKIIVTKENVARSRQIVDDRLAQQRAAELKMRMNAPSNVGIKNIQSVEAQKNQQTTSTESGLTSPSPYTSFANSQPTGVQTAQAYHINHPEYTIAKGEFLHAVMTTAISTDTPGMIEATVTYPVYSFIGNRVLIPVGSRLIGQFSTEAGNGIATVRIFTVWNDVLRPDGVRISLNSGGADLLGRSGQKADFVDTHFWKMFGTGTLLSIIGAAASVGGSTSTAYPTAMSQYQTAITQSFAKTSQKVMNKNLKIQPSLYLDQGTEINVFVAKDLSFYDIDKGKGA
jgi:type IV secretion system protein VirB10